MTNQDRIDLLWQLLVDTFPRFCVSLGGRHSAPSLLIEPESMNDATELEFERAKAHYNGWLLLTDDELTKRVDELPARKQAAFEAKHLFNQPEALVTDEDIEFWSRAEFWSLSESAALINGRNPSVVGKDEIEDDRSETKIAIALKQTVDLLYRAHHAGILGHSNSPKNLIDWLELKHIDLPQNLKDLALKRSATPFTVFAENRRLKEKLAALEAVPTAIESESNAGKTEKSIGLRERESLLKLILGMAIDGYGYDPKANKSSQIKEIAGHLLTHGLSLDEDTVRKYLNEAKALFSEDLNRAE